jgi:hypothetical protein
MSFMMTLPFLLCGSAPAVETNHDRRRALPCAFLQGQQLPLPTQTLTEAPPCSANIRMHRHCEQDAGNDHLAPLISGALIGRRLYFAWALSMVGLSVSGALLATVLLAARYVGAF